VEAAKDDGEITWRLYCLDTKNGKTVWERTIYKGKPKIKRHTKGSHVNSTPCTNGKFIIVFLESHGLYCYDMDGDLAWSKEMGLIDQGWFSQPKYQWGGGASPIIHEDKLILQCDHQGQSFIATYDLVDGKEVWKTLREEVPTWSTPTVNTGKNPQIIVNGYKHMGAYDIKTGKEIWKMSGGGDIPVPTPVIGHDLVFITNAHGRVKPIYAVKTSAKGDITLKDMNKANDHIPWSVRRGGNYMTTPIVYKKQIYCCSDGGQLSCYDVDTGNQVFSESLGVRLAFTASPIIAGGKLYLTGEMGDVYVLKAAPVFKILAKNVFDETCMATPAASEGILYFRTRGHIVAIGKK